MSETISAGSQGSSPGAATGASTQSQGGQTQGGSPGQASQETSTPTEGQDQASKQERILAEQDLDAFIEHTINGKKEKIKVRDLTKSYGLDKAAQQRMEEAARLRKQSQQLMHLMQTDFDKYCEVTGQDPNQFLRNNLSKRKDIAEEVLAKEYELQQMDPHQRRAMELEQENKSFKERELAQKQPLINKIKEIVPANQLPKGLENATAEQLHEFYQAKQNEFQAGLDTLSNELLDAWQKVGLPREKDFGAWMAQVMMDHERRSTDHKKRTGEDLPPLQPSDAAAKVKARFQRSTQSLFSQMDATAIHEFLGEAIIQKLRDHDVNLASQQNGPKFDTQRSPAPVAASEPKVQLNQIEWRKKMGLA